MKVTFLKLHKIDGVEYVNGHRADVPDDLGNELIANGTAVKAPDNASVTVFAGKQPAKPAQAA